MGLTTERKVFFAVLAVAGAALVIDRGILGPSEASADGAVGVEPAGFEPSAETPDPDATQQQQSQSMARVLMDRLEGIEGGDGHGHSLSAAFSLEKFMQAPADAPRTQPIPEVPPAGGGVLGLITADAPDLPALSAVMPSGRGGGAVLDGRLVRVGGTTPGGYTLAEVRERGVILVREGRRYPLEMEIHAGP